MGVTAFITLTGFKFRKILFNTRVVAAVLVGVLVAGVMFYASTLDVVFSDSAFLLDVLVISFFLPVVTMFYGSSVIRDEIEDNSITLVITSPMSRWAAYLSYYVALLMAMLLLMFAILVGGFLAFYVPFGISRGSVSLLGNMLLLTFLGCTVYSALFLLVSVVLERSIYFGLFYAFIWEGFIGSIPGRISEVALKHYIRSIGSARMEFMEFATASGMVYSLYVLTVVLVVLLAVGIAVFRQKEFPG